MMSKISTKILFHIVKLPNTRHCCYTWMRSTDEQLVDGTTIASISNGTAMQVYFSYIPIFRPLPRTPEVYWSLSLPHKLPPKKDPLTVTTLPMLGYLEQMVAAAITKSLTAVGNMKPKYPFMDATQSALIYVGYHLKGTTSL